MVSGCSSNTSPEERVYKLIESSIKEEAEFLKYQEELKVLEEAERNLYESISMKRPTENNEVIALVEQAIENLDKREKIIMESNKDLSSAQRKMEKVQAELEMLQSKKLRTEIEKLLKVMGDRYKAYANLTEKYVESLEENKQLYARLIENDKKRDQIQAQVDLINQSTKEVMKENEKFNKLTERFNKLKLKVYKDLLTEDG